MKHPEDEIKKHREEIDKIDVKLVNLLNKRAKHSFDVKQIKQANNIHVLDEKRENEILEKVASFAESPLDGSTVKEIFKILLKRFKELKG